MARSTNSHNHAKLIREMSRDIARSPKASRFTEASADVHDTQSDFGPDNEAIMSTRRIDEGIQSLPENRPGAQKYSRFQQPVQQPHDGELDYAINTSALGRAFPDFSQGGSTEHSSMSIEVGRGAESRPGQQEIQYTGDSFNGQFNFDEDSLDFSAPVIGNYEVTGTPPLKSRTGYRKDIEKNHERTNAGEHRRYSTLKSQVAVPPMPAAKTKDYGSGDSVKSSGDHGRGLAAMHARVRDEDEQSNQSEERPPRVDITTRSTRFGNAKRKAPPLTDGPLPTRFSSTKGLISGREQNNQVLVNNKQVANHGTQQSFLLPDMPNISELISGVYEDGTPVFSRHSKSRLTRQATSKPLKKPSFASVTEIPIPEDEQAIFLSLKLLQDKVAVLEKDSAEAETMIQELREKNEDLQGQVQSKRQSHSGRDSALGTTDSEVGNDAGGRRKAMIEKNRLESSVRSLQAQLDAANRKSNTAENILKTITRERDSAVSQLGVAYINIEQLKAENEDLKSCLILAKGGDGDAGPINVTTNTEKLDLARSKDNVHSADRPMRKASSNAKTSRKAVATSNPTARYTNRKAQALDEYDTTSSESFEDTGHLDTSQPAQTKPRRIDHKQDSSHPDKRNKDPSRDLTYLSFLDSGEVAKLRKTLEKERLERKKRQSSTAPHTVQDVTSTGQDLTRFSQKSVGAISRKPSLKNVTSTSVQPVPDGNEKSHILSESGHERRHSEPSMLSTRSRRKGRSAENLTSAFIVPDITIKQPHFRAEDIPDLSEEGKAVLDDLAQHSGKNCMVCQQQGKSGNFGDQTVSAGHTIAVPKPVPISERQLALNTLEEEHTIRPAQAPALALATVIKALEDEVVHLKIELSKYQALYNAHDPALSKRRRKSVHEKMRALTAILDVKSDQIYALYDVLEGQKRDGHELSENEVEVTLHSVGVDLVGLQLRGGGDKDKEEAKRESKVKARKSERPTWEFSTDDEFEDDLPWEGIETTVETTKSGFTRSNRRDQ